MRKDFFAKQVDAIEKLDGQPNEMKIVQKINSYLLKLDADIFNLKQRKNKRKILSVEVGTGHDVIRPSIWKYFTELGYEVDFLLYGNKPDDRWNFFTHVKNYQPNELIGDEGFILSVLSLPIMAEYDYIFLNSNFVYTQNRLDTNWDYKIFLKKLKIPDRCKYGYLTIPPHPAYYKNNDKNVQFFTHLGTNGTPMLSVSYFGDVKVTPKSSENIFLISGNINSGQKNHNMIFEAVSQLLDEGVNNFKLYINGMIVKDFVVPERLKDYVKYIGENRPETLFPILEEVDFILSGIDSKSEWQMSTYSKGTCSVGLMYSLGFGKIYVCEDVFAKAFGINDGNALIYKQGNLTDAMKKAIKLSKEDYQRMQKKLLKEAQNRYERSLIDVANTLKKSKSSYKKRSNKRSINNLRELLNYIRIKFCYIAFPKKRQHYKEKLNKI